MITVAEITWVTLPDAERELSALSANEKAALKESLCAYFNSDSGGNCAGKQGKSIAPIRTGVAGAKGLKVRWKQPGGGKSGGLRIAIAAFCTLKRVLVAGAWARKDDPSDDDFDDAFAKVQ